MTPQPPSTKSSVKNRNYKFHNADWSSSILDSIANKESHEFNIEKDSKLFTSSEIEDYMISTEILTKDQQVNLQYKGFCTLEKLKTELLLPSSFSAIKNAENLYTLLKKCANLIRARALTLKILKLIHIREDTILNIIGLEESNSRFEDSYKELVKITDDILQAIGF